MSVDRSAGDMEKSSSLQVAVAFENQAKPRHGVVDARGRGGVETVMKRPIIKGTGEKNMEAREQVKRKPPSS